MQPRSLFDGLLVAILGSIVYVRLVGASLARERLRTVVAVVTGFNLTVYLLAGGIVVIVAIIYMFVYLPQRQSQNAAR
jgi:hypothetical protein